MKENIQNISLDQPVLIDHYLIDKKIPCIITLIRSNNKINEKVYLTATVIREFNGKFLSYAWYMNYDGENSIRLLKLKIDYFSLLLKQLNNENIEITGILDIKVESNLYSAMEYFNSAYDRSNEGKYNEAIQLYSKAIELYPIIERIKMSEAYFNRGLNRRLINDLSGAISDYSEAILIKPDYYKAYYNRGIAKMKKQDFIGAIADFTFVINSENSDKKITASSYGNRGFSKYSIGQYSCSDLKKASELGHETYKSYLAKCE
jgi:tetratricopeptide (TPR) repeat protein